MNGQRSDRQTIKILSCNVWAGCDKVADASRWRICDCNEASVMTKIGIASASATKVLTRVHHVALEIQDH